VIDAALMRHHGCSIGAAPWQPAEPYRLYAIDVRTGAMVA